MKPSFIPFVDCASSQRNYEYALADCDKSIQLEPGDPMFTIYEYGPLRYGDYKRALADYNKAIELDSNAATIII